MKKLLFFLLIVLTNCTNVNENNNKTDWFNSKLKGKVNSMSLYSYTAIEKFGDVVKDERQKYNVIHFNLSGMMLESALYNPDNTLDNKITYVYDEKNNRIEVNRTNADDNLLFKMKNKFDENGNQVESNIYNPDGSLAYRIKEKFDTNNHLIETRMFEPDGKLYGYDIHTTDSLGNILETNNFSNDGVINNKIINKYNKKGLLIEKNVFNHNVLQEKTTYKYNENDNISEEILINKYENTTIVKTYKYTYDYNKNWITYTEYENGIPKSIVEREIIYY